MNKIKVAFFDLDGTITDGMYNVSSDGKITKSFYTRDFHGLEILSNSGICVCIITNSNDDCIKHKLNRLNFNIMLFMDVEDKKTYIDKLIKENNDICNRKDVFCFKDNQYKIISWYSIAYMGDAENDLECMDYIGLFGCPKDAIPQVRKKCKDFVSIYNGGHGAVWEFSKYILEHNKKEN